MSGSDQTVLVMLTVLLVTTALVVGAFVLGLASVWLRRVFRNDQPPLRDAADGVEAALWGFERPNRWVAVKCSNILEVQTALGLDNPTPCPLHEGFTRLSERRLFISPPVKGWILVVGHSLPDASDDVDKLYHFLMKVARRTGSVQYFSVNRALNHHTWVRIENEQVYRAYAWTGETVWNEGQRTAAENELALRCHDYGESSMPFPFTGRDAHVANTDKVMKLAAKWSVDPMAVTSQRALGIVGEFSRRG